MQLIALVPLFPLIGFAINGLFGRKISKSLSAVIASGALLLSFVAAIYLFLQVKASPDKSLTLNLFNWISAGTMHINFEFLVDPLSALFMLIITGIGFLIHLYSAGYMHDDEGHNRFFAYLNLFIFFMLLLVMGGNYVIMFIGWEGVGLCSYLLIGFWFKNTAYNNAAKKAFIINRIGDLGLLLGLMLLFFNLGTLNFGEVTNKASMLSHGTVTAIAVLLFIGAMGKSAQIPLYTWLPDAMAGPTPVSALIHAATMVTAGVYMIVRSNVLYSMSEEARMLVAIVGALTALFAATIGLLQNDIKKVLAYSTVSQLGLMFLALGCGGYVTGVFHVTTHAFFKALLFLGSGSVIHAMGGEQDIRKMGGLKKALPITFITMMIGTIAISGIPPFSGFFSKDEILAQVYSQNKFLWVIASVTSMLTAFYMFRMMFLTFWGSFRGTHEQEHHLHESPKSMTFPLVVLAVLSVVGGFIGLPSVISHHHILEDWLSPVLTYQNPLTLEHNTEWMLMGLATTLAIIMIYIAHGKYVNKGELPAAEGKMTGFNKLVYEKYRIDELYDKVITKPLDMISEAFSSFFDNKIIDALVDGVGDATKSGAEGVRKLQTGNIGFYLLAMVLSVIAMIIVIVF